LEKAGPDPKNGSGGSFGVNRVALHGFLGLPSDWEVGDAKRLLPIACKPKQDFQTFAKELNRWAKAELEPPRVLMGYSLGGRLALHALLDDPSIWEKGILISTHPGLPNDEERCKRFKHDAVWAERFMNDPWEVLMRDWEAQSVFKNETHRFVRKENDYKREDLAKWLTHFSLGVQEELMLKISGLPLPLYWVTGEHDQVYTSLAREACQRHPLSKGFVIPGAHHRACFANPKSFIDFMQRPKENEALR
jgi:2-succinyl-6-hydroxy-2,4-cyclohexadiene-1-carboxylate synthase